MFKSSRSQVFYTIIDLKQIAEFTGNNCDDILVLSIKSPVSLAIEFNSIYNYFSHTCFLYYNVEVHEYKKINENVLFPKLFSKRN